MIRHSFATISFATVFALAMLKPSPLMPQQGHPQFTGTWVLNRTTSKLEVPMPDSTVFVIQQEDPIVRIFRTHATGARVDTATVVLHADSSEVAWTIRTLQLKSRSWWKGNELVFWTAFADTTRPGSQTVRYSISTNGKTFTALERVDTPQDKHLNRWVFDRRE